MRQKQGPKLNFLGRCQVATEIFFSVAIWENVVAKKQKKKVSTGHEIAPDTVANAPKFSVLATKIRKLVATLATRALCFILLLCIVQ